MNTLMIQQVLTELEWQSRLTAADLRALSPLKWQHVNPYGTFTLDMHERPPLEQVTSPPSATLPKFGICYLKVGMGKQSLEFKRIPPR